MRDSNCLPQDECQSAGHSAVAVEHSTARLPLLYHPPLASLIPSSTHRLFGLAALRMFAREICLQGCRSDIRKPKDLWRDFRSSHELTSLNVWTNREEGHSGLTRISLAALIIAFSHGFERYCLSSSSFARRLCSK